MEFTKTKNCESCSKWRYRSDDGEGRTFGVCTAENWGVSMMGEGFIRRYMVAEDWVYNQVLKSIRTEGTFCCNKYEAAENDEEIIFEVSKNGKQTIKHFFVGPDFKNEGMVSARVADGNITQFGTYFDFEVPPFTDSIFSKYAKFEFRCMVDDSDTFQYLMSAYLNMEKVKIIFVDETQDTKGPAAG